MSLGENSLVAAYQGRGQLKSRPSETRVVTLSIAENHHFWKVFSYSSTTGYDFYGHPQPQPKICGVVTPTLGLTPMLISCHNLAYYKASSNS